MPLPRTDDGKLDYDALYATKKEAHFFGLAAGVLISAIIVAVMVFIFR